MACGCCARTGIALTWLGVGFEWGGLHGGGSAAEPGGWEGLGIWVPRIQVARLGGLVWGHLGHSSVATWARLLGGCAGASVGMLVFACIGNGELECACAGHYGTAMHGIGNERLLVVQGMLAVAWVLCWVGDPGELLAVSAVLQASSTLFLYHMIALERCMHPPQAQRRRCHNVLAPPPPKGPDFNTAELW